MKSLIILLVSLMLLVPTTVQADPVLTYTMKKDHNFYHVKLYWEGVYSDRARIFSMTGQYEGWTFHTESDSYTGDGYSQTFTMSRTKRNQPRVFWVCETDPLSVDELGGFSYEATDVCSDPVALSFKNMKPMHGNNNK